MPSKLTVVIPCYNEAKNIPLILHRFANTQAGDEIGLLLVDNGSTDDTEAILAQNLPQFSFANSFKVPINQGYGYGILQGLKQCNTDFIGWTHADMQTDPEDINRAWQIIARANFPTDIYVKGQRRGRPLSDTIFTDGMSIFESLYLGTKLWDINAQPNIFHRSFFQSWTSPPSDFALDLYTYYLAQRKQLTVVRMDVKFPKRVHGQSKWNTSPTAKARFIKRTLDFSIKLKKSLSEN
jgi:polyisoprenyl-phosphate glycosyltransferase